MRAKRLTDDDKKYVLWHWGHERPDLIAKKVGTTVQVCHRYVKKELQHNHLKMTGYTTLRQLGQQTGYSESQINRALANMHMKIYRPTKAKKSPYWLTDNQRRKIIQYLAAEHNPEFPMSLNEALPRLGVCGRQLHEFVAELGMTVEKEPLDKGVASERWLLTEEQFNQLWEHAKKPNMLSTPEVARELGKCRKTVYRVADKLGIPKRLRGRFRVFSRDEVWQLKQHYAEKEGVTMTTLAKQQGRNSTTVVRVAKKLGIVPENYSGGKLLNEQETSAILAELQHIQKRNCKPRK